MATDLYSPITAGAAGRLNYVPGGGRDTRGQLGQLP